jgi:ribosome assembly protein YihI (activator of Der GTPase)
VLNVDTTVPDTAKKVPGYKPAKVTFLFRTCTLTEAQHQLKRQKMHRSWWTGSADDGTTTPYRELQACNIVRRLGNSYTYPLEAAQRHDNQRRRNDELLYQQLSTGGEVCRFKVKSHLNRLLDNGRRNNSRG